MYFGSVCGLGVSIMHHKTKKSRKSHKYLVMIICIAIAAVSVIVLAFAGDGLLFKGKNPLTDPDATNVSSEETIPGEDGDQFPTNPDNGEETAVYETADYLSFPEGLLASGEYSKTITTEGAINILIAGEDKYTLFDTIGIVSIDKKANTVTITMIPRDMYVDYNSGIMNFLKNNDLYEEPGIFKINYTYYLGVKLKHEGKFSEYSRGISFLTAVLEEKFGIVIDDYIKVDTESFVELVDLFGGVDINVPYHMLYEDPEQGLYIHLEAGLQHLDGLQAEGFVRYRKGYDGNGVWQEYGDIARKNHQIAFLKAFMEQHLTLSNITRLPAIVNFLGNNVKSSIKLSSVLSKYIGIGTDIVLQNYSVKGITLSGETVLINKSSYLIVE